jgi:hypothetical protein
VLVAIWFTAHAVAIVALIGIVCDGVVGGEV